MSSVDYGATHLQRRRCASPRAKAWCGGSISTAPTSHDGAPRRCAPYAPAHDAPRRRAAYGATCYSPPGGPGAFHGATGYAPPGGLGALHGTSGHGAPLNFGTSHGAAGYGATGSLSPLHGTTSHGSASNGSHFCPPACARCAGILSHAAAARKQIRPHHPLCAAFSAAHLPIRARAAQPSERRRPACCLQGAISACAF